jgi:hypothetical protein
VSTMNPIELEEAFHEFTENVSKWAPDECIHVNLQLLQNLGLLNDWELDSSTPEALTQQFHVVETSDKVTLFNEQFAVWIVPQTQSELPSTLIMLALIQELKPHLEIVYTTSGVYNTPKYILKVLQHFMTESLDTEATLSLINKKKSP